MLLQKKKRCKILLKLYHRDSFLLKKLFQSKLQCYRDKMMKNLRENEMFNSIFVRLIGEELKEQQPR